MTCIYSDMATEVYKNVDIKWKRWKKMQRQEVTSTILLTACAGHQSWNKQQASESKEQWLKPNIYFGNIKYQI